jgi:hypothetical protein
VSVIVRFNRVIDALAIFSAAIGAVACVIGFLLSLFFLLGWKFVGGSAVGSIALMALTRWRWDRFSQDAG